MHSTPPIEIERKYLIEYPDLSRLLAMPGAYCMQITQTYLLAPAGDELRVRTRTRDERTVFFKTLKRRIDDVRRVEIEEEIGEAEYAGLLLQADPSAKPLSKTRCCVPHAGHLFEIDIYPFWKDRAIAEVELSDAQETIEFPACIKVIREVTGDPAYKNAALAKR